MSLDYFVTHVPGRPNKAPRTKDQLAGLSEQFSAVDDGGLRRAVPADCHPRVFVQCAVVVGASPGMPHEVPGLERIGLFRPEDLALVRVPRTAEHDDVALVGVIVRTAHDTGGEVIDCQVIAW